MKFPFPSNRANNRAEMHDRAIAELRSAMNQIRRKYGLLNMFLDNFDGDNFTSLTKRDSYLEQFDQVLEGANNDMKAAEEQFINDLTCEQMRKFIDWEAKYSKWRQSFYDPESDGSDGDNDNDQKDSTSST